MGTRLSRDQYGSELALVVRRRAACTRRQVGAVVIDQDGRIAGTGYNGVPAGMLHCDEGGCPRGAYTHEQIAPGLGNVGHSVPCIADHAERNAVQWARDHGADLGACTLYVSEKPCIDCLRFLSESDIGRVVVVPV